jgi:Tfp pilus assembly protein PilO
MKHLLDNITLLVCSGLVVLCVAFLVPVAMRLSQVNGQIEDYQTDLREQGLVKPLQDTLFQLTATEPEQGLAAPIRRPLPSEKLRRLPDLFGAPAKENGLALVRLSPDVGELPKHGYLQLPLQVTVRGTCSSFQRYLVAICRLPFLAELRQVDIRRTSENTVEMTISATLNIAA